MSTKFQGRVDPLEYLRIAYTTAKKPKQKDRYLLMENGIKIPLNTPTAWMTRLGKKQLSIGSLWLVMENQLKNVSDYHSKANELGIEAVNIGDRDEIIKYLDGRIGDSSCINQELKLQLASKNGKRDQPTTGTQYKYSGFEDHA